MKAIKHEEKAQHRQISKNNTKTARDLQETLKNLIKDTLQEIEAEPETDLGYARQEKSHQNHRSDNSIVCQRSVNQTTTLT